MSGASSPFPRLFMRFVALPLLFIAGVQLYVLSEQTDVYFAWTIAVPFTAAFLGAGYWAAMVAAYMNWRETANVAARTTGLTSLAATGILGIATFMHLDKFHLNSPEFITRFVTWVWIVVYAVTPFVFLWLWVAYGRSKDESMGAKPFPNWVRAGYWLIVILTLPAAVLLFLAPTAIIPFWSWELTPLTARAVSAWFMAYGIACITINRENNTDNTAGVRISLFAFCALQLIALARYLPGFDLSKPSAWAYLLMLTAGMLVNAQGFLFLKRK